MIRMDGKSLAETRLNLLKTKVAATKGQPGLVVIRVGDDPASKIYVTKKIQTCRELGFHSEEISLPSTTPQQELEARVMQLNQDQKVHGILVQLPLPKPLSEARVIETIAPSKDVDGFHILNRGKLLAQLPCFQPCTPKGIMALLEAYKIKVEGLNAVVLGRSLIVGRPISLLLDHAGATVTVAHSKTRSIDDHLANADLIVSAIGKPNFISKQTLKRGVVLIDVGINRLESGAIVGDIDLKAYESVASYGTPVPGGVGPMTICSLIENTWDAFQEASLSTNRSSEI